MERIRAKADRKILHMLKKRPSTLSVWDTLALSKELREALITARSEPEPYELAELQAQAYSAYVANVSFTEEDMLLPTA